MNSAINRFFIILLLGWPVHVPETLPAKETNRDPVQFARGGAVSDRPVVRQPRDKSADRGTETEAPQGKGRRHGGTPGTGETSPGGFVPSEEIEAGQAVDFPADI